MEYQAVISRLEKLERQNRRMKVVAGIVLMVTCSALLMAWTSPRVQEVVEAKRFVLIHDDGDRTIAELGPNSVGASSLQLFDSQGRTRLVLSSMGWEEVDYTGEVNPVDMLPYRYEKQPGFRLGAPSIVFFDEDGIWNMALHNTGLTGAFFKQWRGGSISIQDSNSKIRFSLGEDGYGLFDKDGNLIWTVPQG